MLYRFFDAKDCLLYIGITANITNRLRNHSRYQPDWRKVATVRIEHHDNRIDLLRAEEAAIKAERPLWNKQHNQQLRTIEEVETLLVEGKWLSVADVMVLFDTSRSAVINWLDQGPKLIGHPLRHRTSEDGDTEICPDSVRDLLVETRIIRSCEFPDGIPGQRVWPPPVRA